MGTTASNLHVHVGDDDTTQADIASLLSLSALVATRSGDWISVYPEPTDIDVMSIGRELATALGRTVVSFLCFDSDIAVATLHSDGAHDGQQLVAGHPGMVSDMGITPDGPVAIEGGVNVWGQPQIWFDVFDRTNSGEPWVIDPDDIFAESVAAALLESIGIDGARVIQAHRFITQYGELVPDDIDDWLDHRV